MCVVSHAQGSTRKSAPWPFKPQNRPGPCSTKLLGIITSAWLHPYPFSLTRQHHKVSCVTLGTFTPDEHQDLHQHHLALIPHYAKLIHPFTFSTHRAARQSQQRSFRSTKTYNTDVQHLSFQTSGKVIGVKTTCTHQAAPQSQLHSL
jgi:hypothetical protein